LGKTLRLIEPKVMDLHRAYNHKYAASSTNELVHTFATGNETLNSFANHIFLIPYSELNSAGLKANNKIGKMLISANITDTMKNVIVRVRKNNAPVLTSYEEFTDFDTVAIHTFITPEDCVDGKLLINFMKDYV
jgi:hypothetical protein